jgi:hypothetical protein
MKPLIFLQSPITLSLFGPNIILSTLYNLIPSRNSRRNIPNEKLTLPLQQGGPLPSTVGARNRTIIWTGQIETEFCDPPLPNDGKQQTAAPLSPPAPKEVLPNTGGRGYRVVKRDDGAAVKESLRGFGGVKEGRVRGRKTQLLSYPSRKYG